MNAECGLRLCLTHRRTRDARRTFRSKQTSGSLQTHKRTRVSKRGENQNVNACLSTLYLPNPDVKTRTWIHTQKKREKSKSAMLSWKHSLVHLEDPWVQRHRHLPGMTGRIATTGRCCLLTQILALPRMTL